MLKTDIKSVNTYQENDNLVILTDKSNISWAKDLLQPHDFNLVQKAVADEAPYILLNNLGRWILIEFNPEKGDENNRREIMRRNAGNRVIQLRNAKISTSTLINKASENLSAEYVEGLVLGNYRFLKYFKQAAKQESAFKSLQVLEEAISPSELATLKTILTGVCIARDLVNEPHSYLNAVQLAKEIEVLGQSAGFSTQTLDKAALEKLGMGGLLAVNMGSVIPPTFNIMEWKPAHAKNQQPIVLVGKGVVYDTGGLSLKPTANSMDFMKSDMAGAALVIATLYVAAQTGLPLHIIGLVPATDNRPGQDAYAPGDIIKMYSGSFVEVLNTDAEGRMILADALHYAKQYNPEFVFDFATLTGAASAAIGPQACVMMGNMSEELKNRVKTSGYRTYERVVEFPMWEEYGEEIKSDIADLKNIGGSSAGAITAGKFLEHFTDYPWLHFDIAGVAFLQKESTYKVKGGTGFGVRLLYDFLKEY